MKDRDKIRVDFDRFAAEYEALLTCQLAFFDADRDYFSAYKIALLRRLLPGDYPRILDFGAGIGLIVPHLQRAFPGAAVSASDISAGSLEHLRQSHPGVAVIADPELDRHRFDLVLVSTVLHHVPPSLRPALLGRLDRLVAPGGALAIFEHNPWNPVTRRMVSTCAFDADAVLLDRSETIRLVERHTTMRVAHAPFTLFFPKVLGVLRPLERHLGWLPLGGQYAVIARKPAERSP